MSNQYRYIERWSNHHSPRGNATPRVIVLHHTGGSGNVENEVAYLVQNRARVSAHFVIAKDGTQYRMVRDEHAAHHCGFSRIGAIGLPNQSSFGIELINTGAKRKLDPWPDAQVESCAQVVWRWMQVYDIEMVTSHRGIDTMGKYDPHLFPWKRFYAYLREVE